MIYFTLSRGGNQTLLLMLGCATMYHTLGSLHNPCLWSHNFWGWIGAGLGLGWLTLCFRSLMAVSQVLVGGVVLPGFAWRGIHFRAHRFGLFLTECWPEDLLFVFGWRWRMLWSWEISIGSIPMSGLLHSTAYNMATWFLTPSKMTQIHPYVR
jgi:hypothetical protein